MVESDSFPYVEGKHGAESEEHVKLKGLAVYWLLQRGFDLENIEEEHAVKPEREKDTRGNTRYADIYAEQDGREVYIECERGNLTRRSVSMAGTQKAKSGEAVFVFGENGVYRLHYTVPEKEGVGFDSKIMQLDRVQDLPMLDLSAYE